MSQNPHLVETVMINVADFAESFLTCGTCLSGYDSEEHSAKLLPCSHTLCRACLQRILDTSATSTSVLMGPPLRSVPGSASAATPSATATLSLTTPVPNATSTIRCPICREVITVPLHSTAASFPPAFIVNQLLDLLASQRRDLVPKCVHHPSLELLFCETCDVVFCSRCGLSPPLTLEDPGLPVTSQSVTSRRSATLPTTTASSSSTNNAPNACCSAQHNVVTFTVALKRCHEILLHKASLCLEQLNGAEDSVARELHRLEENTNAALCSVNECFDAIVNLVRQRRQSVLHRVAEESVRKRGALTEQLTRIHKERSHIEEECDSLSHVADVRRISKAISGLNEKLDQLSLLAEPRVNAYICYKTPLSSGMAKASLQNALKEVAGTVVTSETFPPLCKLTLHRPQVARTEDSRRGRGVGMMLTWIAHFKQTVTLETVGNNGEPRNQGGDPVEVEFQSLETPFTSSPLHTQQPSAHSLLSSNHISIRDLSNGTYSIQMRPARIGRYRFTVRVLDRHVRRVLWRPLRSLSVEEEELVMRSSEEQLLVDVVSAQTQPVWCCRSSAGVPLCQPFAVCASPGLVHVLDTGNGRVLSLRTADGGLVCETRCSEPCMGQAATGLAIVSPELAWVSNWRCKFLYLVNLGRNEVVSRLHCPQFQEPSTLGLVLTSGKEEMTRLLVVDNAARCIWLVSVLSQSSGQVSHECVQLMELAPDWGLVNGILVWAPVQIDTALLVLASDHVLQLVQVSLLDNRLLGKVTLAQGHFGGVAQSSAGALLTSVNERGSGALRVFHLGQVPQVQQIVSGAVPFYDVDTSACGETDGSRPLRRLAGVAILPEEEAEAVLVDVGSFCVARVAFA